VLTRRKKINTLRKRVGEKKEKVNTFLGKKKKSFCMPRIFPWKTKQKKNRNFLCLSKTLLDRKEK
jgi:hypothetical protein